LTASSRAFLNFSQVPSRDTYEIEVYILLRGGDAFKVSALRRRVPACPTIHLYAQSLHSQPRQSQSGVTRLSGFQSRRNRAGDCTRRTGYSRGSVLAPDPDQTYQGVGLEPVKSVPCENYDSGNGISPATLTKSMDLQKLLAAVEEFVYEIGLWTILLPKTLLLLAFRPKKITEYVNAELDKPATDRYAEYLSPITFWLLLAVVPSFVLGMHYLRTRIDPFSETIASAPVKVRFAALIIFLLWPPLTFAISTLIREKTKLTRESLRRPFYVQCMCLAPFYSMLLAVTPAYIRLMEQAKATGRELPCPPCSVKDFLVICIACGAPLLVWYIEGRLIGLERKTKWFYSMFAAALTFFVGTLLLFTLEMMGLILLITLR
jgi:hypothetical protein